MDLVELHPLGGDAPVVITLDPAPGDFVILTIESGSLRIAPLLFNVRDIEALKDALTTAAQAARRKGEGLSRETYHYRSPKTGG